MSDFLPPGVTDAMIERRYALEECPECGEHYDGEVCGECGHRGPLDFTLDDKYEMEDQAEREDF